jgi:hypothetical protein
MPDLVPWTAVTSGWLVVDASGVELGRVREVMGEGDVLLGVLAESGSLGATQYHPADQIAEIREGKVRLAQ